MAVYDDQEQKTLPDDDELRRLTGISSNEEMGVDKRASGSSGIAHAVSSSGLSGSSSSSSSGAGANRTLSPSALGAAEASPNSSNSDAGGNVSANPDGGFWSGGSSDNSATGRITGVRNFFWGSRRRKQATIGGGGIITIAIGAVIGMSALSGPAELIQLSQILDHNYTKSQSDSQSRTNHLLRDWKALKTGDNRYTRVGLIGQKVVGKVIGQFKEAGVEFTGSDALGRPTGIKIDRATVEKNFPEETKGMSPEEFGSWLNEKFGITSGKGFTPDGELDISGLKSSSIKTFLGKANTEILGNSKVTSALKLRYLKKFFGVNDLFHPFSKAIEAKIAAKKEAIKKSNPKESDGAAEETAATDVESSNFNDSLASTESPGVEDWTTGHDRANSPSTKTAAALLPYLGYIYGAGCTLQATGQAMVSVNRYLIVLPAAAEAVQLMGMGSQLQNGGSDNNLEQVSSTVSGFTASKSSDPNTTAKNDIGKTIWAGAALQATEGASTANNLPKNTAGNIEYNMPQEYKQAFGLGTLASVVKDTGSAMLLWFPPIPKALGGKCGPIAGWTMAVVGVVAQVAIAVANAPDGESLDTGSQAAVKGLEDVGVANIKSKIYGPIMEAAIKWVAKATAAPKLIASSFSGPTGGDLITFGARAAANTSAILDGGLSMGNNAATTVGMVGAEQQQQFRSESTFAKIFDVNDYRSLLGHLSMDIGPNLSTDLSSGISSIFNIGGSISSIFSDIIPKASAASSTDSWSGSYDWGFPQYGIPNNMLSDPALSDPYQNAQTVGKYLSSVCKDKKTGDIGPTYGDCASGDNYTQRIQDCFGNTLTYSADSNTGTSTSVWDVTPSAVAASSDVNPVSDTYQNANCGVICPGTISTCGNTEEENWERIVMFINDANNIKSLDCMAGYTTTSNQSCQDEGMGDNISATSTSQSGVTSTAGG